MARNTQGIHAPLRLNIEKLAASKVGHLPCITRHHFMEDVLSGRDEEIDFTDVLNQSEFSEEMIMPHIAVERSLGIL